MQGCWFDAAAAACVQQLPHLPCTMRCRLPTPAHPPLAHACSHALPSPLQGVAGEVVKAVQEGHLKHIFLVGGCDGHGEWRGGLGGVGGGVGDGWVRPADKP